MFIDEQLNLILQADLNQAISMVSYYASSSEPAQIRGKTVYIQYSNRHEIVNNQSPGDVPGNVLLVTFEGVESHEVSIDVIHLVSALILILRILAYPSTCFIELSQWELVLFDFQILRLMLLHG